jgi:hypothetical protein
MKKILYSFVLCCMLHGGLHAQSWNLTGNAATTPGTHFVGTTDAKALMFKVNNQRSAIIDFAEVKANTSFGFQALKSPTTGKSNAAFGYKAAFSMTTGISNTAAGAFALFRNTVGYNNVAVGDSTLYNNGLGVLYVWHAHSNTALGSKALYGNTTGSYNTAIGTAALYANTTGIYNTAVGYRALYSNTVGWDNTAIGYVALASNTTGEYNTALGKTTLSSNTIGKHNTAVGHSALSSNTTGWNNIALGSYALNSSTEGHENTAIGVSALSDNTTGGSNTALGEKTLRSNTTGYSNSALGSYALYSNTTGNNNIALGSGAGSYNNNNTLCTFVGYDADQSVTTDFTNSTALGNGSRITTSNQVRIGNSYITSIGGYQNWTNISDGRFKKNVKENVPGLKFINLLKPVTYNLDVEEVSQFLGEDRKSVVSKAATGQEADEREQSDKNLKDQGRKAKAALVTTGFVAQEVEAAAKKIGYDFSGVDKPQNEHSPYGLRYAEFVVPLVKAVQELSKLNDEKDTAIEQLKAQNQTLESRLARLEAMMNVSSSSANQQSVNLSAATLLQNVPNPFIEATTIGYTLPPTYTVAKLILTDKNGKTLKEVNISGSGKGSVNIDASTLASGAYQYSLHIDGKLITTKQMVKVK